MPKKKSNSGAGVLILFACALWCLLGIGAFVVMSMIRSSVPGSSAVDGPSLILYLIWGGVLAFGIRMAHLQFQTAPRGPGSEKIIEPIPVPVPGLRQRGQLLLPYHGYEVFITYESPATPCYDPRDFDDPSTPNPEYFIEDEGTYPTSRHRVTLRRGNEVFAHRVLLATGGASGVHGYSGFIRGNTCFLAVGPFICALELPTLRVMWHKRADETTCFGLHHAPTYASIISHGEVEIARLDYTGERLWSRRGEDVFSEGFRLLEHHVEAIDFNRTVYRFNLKDGSLEVLAAAA